MSKYARTTITNEDGTITKARLNLETGEIKPYKHYKELKDEEFRKRTVFKRREDGDSSQPLFWEIIPPPTSPKIEFNSRHQTKSKQNSNNIYLKEFQSLDDAKESLPMLDDLIVGVSHLDLSNNMKPINKGLLFRLLRDVDEINSQSIRAYAGCSESYAHKLSQALKVLSNAFDCAVES